jgi:isopenicillin-N N-acyltransferase like protein
MSLSSIFFYFLIKKSIFKMKNKIYVQSFALCMMLITSLLACNAPAADTATTTTKAAVVQPITNKKDVPVIELSGNGYQRGLQHGKVLKTEIAEVFKKWKNTIQNDTKQNADTVIANFLKATNFEPAIRKWTPEIFDEIKGISESSGQSFQDVFTFQLLDEFWVYFNRLKNIEKHHCSDIGVAASDTHPAYVSQNMDLDSYMNGYQILLHIASTPNEPEQYILSCAGLVALNGVNSKGIALCMNTLMDLNASSDGLPVACIVRGVLAQKEGDSALKFLKTVPHASGQNYTLGIIDKVYDFEGSANKVVRFLPDPTNEALVYHTNHALANDDIKPWFEEKHKKILSGELKDNNTVVRFASLKNRLNKSPNTLSDDIIKETLRAKDDPKNPVCRAFEEGKSGFTFSSVIFTLGKNPSVQITNGSPDQSEYVLHTFKEK